MRLFARELGLMVLVVALYAKAADLDNDSPLIWAGISLVVCLLCLAIPLPFLRVLIAAVLSLIAIMAYKAIQER